MLVDFAADVAATPIQVEAAAVAAEKDGYDGFGAAETKHDVFPALALAARATSRITVQSAIAVAFARNPMSVAVLANDLQLISEGRFQLGLGSQVQPHIERRFAMPWSKPAARMEEFIRAIRAIWTAWGGERLAFRGEFYKHTLMTDFFNPGPNPYGTPPVLLAAVGERMTRAAGRVADGLLVHPLTSAVYLSERTRPVLQEARGGALDDFTVCLSAMVVLGADEAARSRAEQAVKGQIAFYASTPAYRPVLETHGWGELADQLNSLSRRQAWAEMTALISDEVLDTFAVTGDVAAGLRSRFGDLVDRISLYTPYDIDPALIAQVRQRL
ncbi:TIGR03617 family F420-dependent LLM class oxidoreductase [Actinoplanes sp. TRM 88003]|uniref:TIGR03617 family F420-dependent LLM class oxidoreductase n=1 Tax=Paractinoplanes aksuensis TaxID=2939490 RepID=A0ABT1DYG5_9ACTN|nr:TIGR03617 family F420-dependent LLM class oxidoreductase [Actinoplanes aksuensis]MCO8275930.1 TIGR03617 family F420-dependent LLM class oxidoreductase [Actinoplanes aksuensis]